MIVDIIQKNKELFSAEFDIIENNSRIGTMRFQTKMYNTKGSWECNYKGCQFLLKSEKHNRSESATRPYSLYINNNLYGRVLSSDKRVIADMGINVYQLYYGNNVIEMYTVGKGKEMDQIDYPVYSGNYEVALFEKPRVVINDLHNYHLTSLDDNSTFESIILCCYNYALVYFNKGVKYTKSRFEYNYNTIDREYLLKDNPYFKYNVH